MKKIMFAAIFLSLALMPALANEGKRALAEQLYSAMKSEKMAEQVLESLLPSMKQMVQMSLKDSQVKPADVDSVMIKLKDLCLETFPQDQIRELNVNTYMEVFSQEELEGILAFYNSPVGKVFADKQQSIIKSTGEKVQPIFAAWFPVFQQKADALIKEYLSSKQ